MAPANAGILFEALVLSSVSTGLASLMADCRVGACGSMDGATSLEAVLETLVLPFASTGSTHTFVLGVVVTQRIISLSKSISIKEGLPWLEGT